MDEELPGKKKKNQIPHAEISQSVTAFMGKLREAVEEDKKCSSKKLPAINKLKLITTIEKFLSNTFYQKLFLNMGGLDILKEWLKKNRDGTYPIINQITKMLDVLSNLQIGAEHLKHSDIGGYIMELSKNMKDSKPIQKKANDIVSKWSRIIFEINTDYSNIEEENLNYKQVFISRKRQREFEDKEEQGEDDVNEEDVKVKKEENKESSMYKHAMIPKKGYFDFTERPVPSVNESKMSESKNKFQTLFNGKNKK
jgi:transcription factor SPN1